MWWSQQTFCLLILHITLYTVANATFDIPSFDWIQDYNNELNKKPTTGNKPKKPTRQKSKDFLFAPKNNFKGQEVEEIPFHKQERLKGPEHDDFYLKPKKKDQKRKKEKENIGPKPKHPVGQEAEEFTFAPKPQHPVGQETEDFIFGPKPDHPVGQETEDIIFGSKPDHPVGQETEDIIFGSKPDNPFGQEVEEINFGSKPKHPTGQEVEEINFGQKPEHPIGQEVEEINFGPKPKHPTGQEVEEINFGPKPKKPAELKTETTTEPKPKHPAGQEVEEINFGSKPKKPTAPKIETTTEPKPEHPVGQEVEEINFGPKPKKETSTEQPTGQEVEEIFFGSKQKKPTAETSTESKPEHPPGQQVEEINFGPKPKKETSTEHPTGQELNEIPREPKTDSPKGQEVEEINFGYKPDHPTGQELNEIHFVPKTDSPTGQEVEEIHFGPNEKKGDLVDVYLPATEVPGCEDIPKVPPNSKLKCESNRKCKVTCLEGYTFPTGGNHVELECDNGKWISHDNVTPECKAVCEPPCQNKGHCIAPNRCRCPKNYEGPQCQFKSNSCTGHPPVAKNSHVNCNASNCVVQCFDTYAFPDGTSTADLICREGQWIWTRPDWESLPDCKPSCTPPCVNGGICLDFNKCQCPRQYVGPQCQYELSACDAQSLNFNGVYTCRGESDKVSCILSCPDGHQTDTPLADAYICHYSTGKFYPEPVPKCIYDKNAEVVKFASSSHTIHKMPKDFDVSQNVNQNPVPTTAECSSWKRSHYKNFDGEVFSFDGNCSYVLAKDVVGNSFQIITENSKCETTCLRYLIIFYQDQVYKLHYDGNTPILTVNGNTLQVPHQLTGFSVEKAEDHILVNLQDIDVSLSWNAQDQLSLKVNENFWNKTGGLCGNFNNNPHDDFHTPNNVRATDLEMFLLSWQHDSSTCESLPETKSNCKNEPVDYCQKVFSDPHFEKCMKAEKFALYQEACAWDVCKCGKSCACDTISEFVKNCRQFLNSEKAPDSTSDWRQITDCPLNCPPGKVYSDCGPSIQATCGSLGMDDTLVKYSECAEGCFCPEGLILFNETCIRKEYCSCSWRNKYYNKGDKIQKDCNTCTCQNGEWTCTTLKCSTRCSVVGNSHYYTFDGRRYDLNGQCGYYLLKSNDYTIQSENLPCDKDFANEIFHNYVSKHSFCTKIITVKHKTDEIKLKMNKEVIVNGHETLSLPTEVNGVIIRLASHFIIVTLPDGAELWWDGNTNIYIELPGNHKTATGGLCGTSNNNQKDDFMTPEGDIEQTALSFAEKWKTDETCTEVIDPIQPHPCDANTDFKEVAEKHCQKLKGSIFKDCHSHVDVEPFYKNCLHDVCSCQKDVKACFCPIFADYAKECSRESIEIPWRYEMRECGLHCPEGQIYQPCGDSCGRSCQDISITKGHCDKRCAEGCGCSDGLVLNSENLCIPVNECPCFHQNIKYKARHQLIMESDEGPQFCVCQNALWTCRPATPYEIARDYENSDLKCNETLHEEYTTCKPAEPKTCKNMHEKQKYSTRICFPGCVCKKGYVWDSIGKLCVTAHECPCHHGGRSYADGETIQEDCNACTCKNGVWSCTKKECPSVCSTWGDSHFKTFDGKVYDFQGSCEFILAAGSISEYDAFAIELQIVPCGSTGISCPKSLTLKVGPPPKDEKVVFKKSKQFSVPKGLERILVREVGLFVFAEVYDLGIIVQWDRGTRVYVKADSRWKNKVKGLCGSFNDNELDDFKTPSSGETSEISPVLFADSWRLQQYCPESSPIADTCARRPHRRAWALEKCSVLNSETFELCHSEVPLEPYLERCIVDTCGCDEGGDCECLCTAIAAYAEECTLRGVPIKWRTQELCPIQCEDDSKYNSCVSTCPPKSCDNQYQHSAMLQTCNEKSCVEGCDKLHCPPGEVLVNSSSNICIPIASCNTTCLTIDGKIYLEGDLIESDDCHSCYCSHHAKVCVGEPCPEVTSTPFPLPTPTSICPDGEVWDDCIVKCNHVCNYLRPNISSEFQCSNGENCISGCRVIDLKCHDGMFLRDKHTCVQKKDCPCWSSLNSLVKPGDVVQESECEKCQCINNEYECVHVCTAPIPLHTTPPSYNYTRKRISATTGWDFSQGGNVTLIFHTTPSPPVICPTRLYESLINPFTRFTASSYLDETSSPVFGQMSAKGTWKADINDADQYLQVDLGKVEPVYGVNVAGDPGNYVSNYNVLYSLNGEKYININGPDGKKEIFGGPFDGHHSVKQVFPTPVEARYIRFHPTSWHGQISMKVDVLGCSVEATTLPFTTATVPSICNKPIGIGQKYFPKLKIIATSSKPNNSPDYIGFDNEKGWQPLTNSKSEWVQLDFGDYVNFTGIITRGVSETNKAWVERYKVEYSHDGLTWNPVLDEFGDEMTFVGNTDAENEKKNFFSRPIHAKSLKILPLKWHESIALRLDVMGCYEPPHYEVEVTPPVIPKSDCNVCTGVVIDKEQCKCKEEEWWNGENCVSHSECPCFSGLIAYPVGSTFTTENCEECTCRLFGLSHCTPKQCEDCPEGLQKVLTPLCGCTCKPCEEDSRLCPSSNICLKESAWCDGVQDCPDDEINCTTPTPKVTPTPTPCIASCPPTYDVVYRNKTAGPSEADDMTRKQNVKSIKTKSSVKTYRKSKKSKKFQKMTECPRYDCVPPKEITATACPPIECPVDYKLVYENESELLGEACPLYTCEPLVEYANCSVLSKNIKTFDGLEYKYEICDHVLATHDSGLWNVTMLKNCNFTTACTTVILINHNGHTLELHPHNLIIFDSYTFTPNQLESLNSKMSDFSLTHIGNFIIFKSDLYGFEVAYDTSGNVLLQVPNHNKGHLLGLCGLYNGQPNDDKTLPDGKLSKTTVEFGDSWFNPGGKVCIETVCPTEMQKEALDICRKLKEKPFNLCREEVNLELCIESTCDCLTSNKTVDECRCQKFSDFATKCKNSVLFGWRVEHDCPSSCPPNLVHYDCYPYACQPTCGNEECTEPALNCYSGCFCPDGLVKKGDQCIKVADCRDCVCSGVGDSTYLTFDGGLTFNGKCTYVATREKRPDGTPGFEVLISNNLCNGSDFMTCTEKVEINVPGHSIKLIAITDTPEMVLVLVDGFKENIRKSEKIDLTWAKISFNPDAASISVQLPKEHVDVRYFYKRFAFTISLPSHFYSDRVEGLCGSCSKSAEEPGENDNPEIWQTEKDENCMVEPPLPCVPTPEHIKICQMMNDTKIFGKCLPFVDPTPFIDQCLTLLCLNGHVCNGLEAYAQACRDENVCVSWRTNEFCPFTCPSDLEYQPCNVGCHKTCDNYHEISTTCSESPIEGCFCPEGEILINGTCKPEKYCEYCDKEGHHFEDETWRADKCTNCSCRNHLVTCEKTECPEPDIVCGEDYILVKEENDGDCCPKYKCACKRTEDCEKIEIPTDLLPGMEAIVNETGCCPKVNVVCRKENCPLPKPCKQHYVQKMYQTNCCPEYFCEKPPNLCIFALGETSGKEETRKKRHPVIEIAREVGERWSDGPCKTCVCVMKNEEAEVMCTVTECPSLTEHHDYNDYELEEVPHPDKCCPEVVRLACKHNGIVYKVGDTWVPDENNPCETMKCNKLGGVITKETRLEVCNRNCDPGWEYKHAEGACCGHCVQVGCLADDKVYKEGEFWFSEDKCAKSTCSNKNGHFIISTEMKSCPLIEDCPQEDIYQEECCLKCKIRPEDKKICATQILPPDSTIKLIKQKRGKHGECTNLHPIGNFTQCVGNCASSTEFKPETSTHESICTCCKPQEFSLLTVELKCEDGTDFMKTLTVPAQCSCLACGG